MIGLNINFMRQLIHVASHQPVKTGDRIFMDNTLIEVTDYNIPDLVKKGIIDFAAPKEEENVKCPCFINPKHVDRYNEIVTTYASGCDISPEEVEDHLMFLYQIAPHTLLNTLLYEMSPFVEDCKDGIWVFNSPTGEVRKIPYQEHYKNTFAPFASYADIFKALDVVEPLYEELYGE